MSRIVALALLLTGCNVVDRPVVNAGPDDEVVALPNGGALIVRRALQERQEPTCYVRARFSGTFVPMGCDEARLVNIR